MAESSGADLEAAWRRRYALQYPLMRLLGETGTPLPKTLLALATVILDDDARKAIGASSLDLERLREAIRQAEAWRATLNRPGLSLAVTHRLGSGMRRLAADPDDPALLEDLISVMSWPRSVALDVDLWTAQNLYYGIARGGYLAFQARAKTGDAVAAHWLERFTLLGDQLAVDVPDEKKDVAR
jgi:hypothetical protein